MYENQSNTSPLCKIQHCSPCVLMLFEKLERFLAVLRYADVGTRRTVPYFQRVAGDGSVSVLDAELVVDFWLLWQTEVVANKASHGRRTV